MKEFMRYMLMDMKRHKGKISDQMLSVKVGFSVVIILFCVAMLSLSAYAFFTHNMVTQVGGIQAASYDLEIRSQDGLTPDQTGAYFLDNSQGEEEKIFSFILEKTEDSTASVGYGKMKVSTDLPNHLTEDGCYDYYTQPIGLYLRDGVKVLAKERTVYVRVAPFRTASVSFIAQWGSTAEEPMKSGKYAWPGYSPLTEEEEQILAGGQPQEQEKEEEGNKADAAPPAEEQPPAPQTSEQLQSPADSEELPAAQEQIPPASEQPSEQTPVVADEDVNSPEETPTETPIETPTKSGEASA